VRVSAARRILEGDNRQQLFFLCELQAEYRVEAVEDAARFAAVLGTEAIATCVVDQPIEQRGEMEESLTPATEPVSRHRCAVRPLPTRPGSPNT